MSDLNQRKALLMQAAPQLKEMGFDTSQMTDQDIQDIPEDVFQRKIQDVLNPKITEEANEFHPDIPVSLRAAIKSFGGEETAKALEYARQQAPGLQWAQKDGTLYAKKADEKVWRKLDPSSLTPMEAVRDVLDLGYDIPAGALAAAPLAFGPLGVPASAGVGTGLEALRQYIGKSMGIRQDYSPTEMTLQAAAPILPGVAAKGVKKAAGLTAKLGSIMGDVPQEALASYADAGFRKAAQALRASETAMYAALNKVGQPIVSAVQSAKQHAGANLENALQAADQEFPAGVSTGRLKKQILDFIKSEKGPRKTTGSKQIDAELNQIKSDFLGLLEGDDQLSATQLFALQRKFDSLARGADKLAGKPVEDQRVKLLATRLSDESKKLQNMLYDKVPDTEKARIGSQTLGQLRGEYGTALRQEEVAKHAFGQGARPYTRYTRGRRAAESLSGPEAPISYEQLGGIIKDVGAKVNQPELSKLMAATSIEGRPLLELPGTSSVIKFGSIPAAAGGLMGGYPGAIVGGVTGAGTDMILSSPMLMSRLIEAMGMTQRGLGTRKAGAASSALMQKLYEGE